MEMPILSGASCACCGHPLAGNGADSVAGLCRECRLAPPPFERAVAYGVYEDRLREAIHALKYNRMHPAARRLGALLAQAMQKIAEEAPAEMLVVPVPLHRSKHAQRGFNQARALAEHAVRWLRRSHPEWRLTMAGNTLLRVRATETQAGLSPRQRRINMRAAFQVAEGDAVRGRDLLLVDDILTTGATARAASLALKRAGAKTVWVATLARARRVFPAPGGRFELDSFEDQSQIHSGDQEIDREITSSPGTHGAPAETSRHSSVSSFGEFI
jgi:ComF family protein